MYKKIADEAQSTHTKLKEITDRINLNEIDIIDITGYLSKINRRKKFSISPNDEKILSGNPTLHEAIFNGGISDLIISDKATIEKLNGQPKELLNILRNSRMKQAILDGAISVEYLTGVKPSSLENANKLLHKNIDISAPNGKDNFSAIVKLLGLNEVQIDKFKESISKNSSKPIESMPNQAPVTPLRNIKNKDGKSGYTGSRIG